MDTGMMETGRFEITGAEGSTVKLAMQRLWLTGQILPVGARLLVRHVFANAETHAVEVVYGFMLPRDAALRRFDVQGEGFEACSELRRVADAVREYEEGIAAGHLATLARSYRDGVVNLTLGNLRPGEQVAVTLEVLAGVELRDDGLRFRFPFTLAPAYHAGMKAIGLGGLGEIELPQADFGDVILPRFKRGGEGLHQVGFDLAVRLPGATTIGSPSHAVQVRDEGGARRVSLAVAGAVPDRDLVLDVRVDQPQPAVLVGEGRFAIVVPSVRFGAAATGPRRIAIVIDRSGSMQGQPMTQAKRSVEACLGALSQEDQFALVAFDNSVDIFRQTLSPATMDARAAAGAFLAGIDARGGTELAAGFVAGARAASGGDVLVITDGQVMGTEDILAQARALNVRIHCLGIGAASQDRFLSLLASSTGGVSRFVTPQERVDLAAVDLFASIGRPVATSVRAEGAVFAVQPADTVFAGTPWVAFGEAGTGCDVRVTWSEGRLTERIGEPMPEVADTVRLLAGARLITDLESRTTGRFGLPDEEVGERLAQVSAEYGLASRAMALVAVVKRAGDVAGAPPRTQVVPVGMPQDTQFGSYFGAAAGGPAMAATPVVRAPMASRSRGMSAKLRGLALEVLESLSPAAEVRAKRAAEPSAPSEVDRLMEIAARLAPDGGVAGGDPEDRALRTACAVLAFLAEGHTPAAGAFRSHVARMVAYLEGAAGLSPEHAAIVARVIELAKAGRQPKTARPESWADVAKAVE
jgi:Ca-activated chloride channel family protein